jgi:hypothetical protein
MHALYKVLSFAALSVAVAQSTLPIEAIEAHFSQSLIVPQLLSSFDPSALLAVNFAGVGDITPGQLLTKDQSAPTPTITVTAANASVQLNGTYTITMVDADFVGADLSKGVNRHWLINGVAITDGKISNASATAITTYAGPAPPAGSGPHRYTIILYEQPSTFSAPDGFQNPIGVTLFDLSSYIKDSGLGPLVAATYFRVEEGTATGTIPATSAVVTSTLPAAQSKTTGSGSASTASATPKANGAITLGNSPSVFLLLAGLASFLSL